MLKHKRLYRFLPGVLLCVGVTVFAMALQMVEQRLVGQPYIEALVLAILVGVAVRTVWCPGSLWSPGIRFSAKTLLEVAVMMLGASVSVQTLMAIGAPMLVGILVIVAVAIVASLTYS